MTSAYFVERMGDAELLEGLATVVARSRAADAAVLAYLAEVDERRLYLPAACASMHGYCVRVLRMSEDAAFKRIAAARAARRFPSLLAAIADGRLHLSGVVMLAPHLTDDSVDERVAAASHRSKRELEVLIAAWAPRPDVPARLEPLPVPLVGVEVHDEHAPGRVDQSPPAIRTTPLAPERFALQVTIDQATREKLERAQALLRHRVPSGDLAQVIDRALDALLARLMKEKFADTDRPRRRPSHDGDERSVSTRHVPAEVRRAVHARDGEQCTFVSADGVRCTERGFLELDHVEAFALGGRATVDNLRTACSAHNQHAADRRFGRAFMEAHRQRRPARALAVAVAAGSSVDVRGTPEHAPVRDVAPAPVPEVAPAPDDAAVPDLAAEALLGLRGLGVTATDARDAIARSAHVAATTLPERMRAALQALRVTYASRSAEPASRWGGGRGGYGDPSSRLEEDGLRWPRRSGRATARW